MTDVTGKTKMPISCRQERLIKQIAIEMTNHGKVQCLASGEHGNYQGKDGREL